jgi:hypothetical protein
MRHAHWLLALLALAPPIAAAQGAERREFSFELKAPGEAVAEVVRLRGERNAQWSAPGAGLNVERVWARG